MTPSVSEAPILEVKLYPATGTGRPLPRPRLESAADVLEGRYPVVLVVAPAGYGKSTLMAQWHAALIGRGVACAWLSLDGDDDDKARFMRYLVAALRRADAQIGRGLEGQLGADFTSSAKPLLETLAADLAALRRRIVLFLDDLQFVSQPEVLEVVDWLANYAPRTVQFVIGSREEPRLRLGGLRVRRQLLEVDVRQLQFGADEAAHFFRSRLGRDVAPRDLSRLLEKTEGWPAALELAAMALGGAADATALIEQFAGSDRGVVEYLGEVVLARLDERTREFVFQISLFDRICAPLAQSAGGIDDAQALLDSLNTSNLFLIPLDRSGTWMRFHHLVGDYFRERFGRLAPERSRESLIRGANWLHANGHASEAVHAAIRARDWERATLWVAECVDELALRRGEHQTILRWMNALPADWVDRHPAIRIQFAFSLSFYPMRQEYEAQIHRLRSLLAILDAEHADDRRRERLRCAIEMQEAMALALRDEGSQGGERAAAWLARWPDAPLQQKGVMGNVLAFGHKTTGEIDQGLQVLGQTRRWLEQGEGLYSLAWTGFVEAVLHLKRGSYFEARRACIDGLELVDRSLSGHPAHGGLFHALLAAIAYEFDEIAAAVEHLERAMTGIDDYGPADALILAYLTQARLQRLRHDEDSAMAILREGQTVGERRALPRVTVTLAAEECNGLARVGRHDEARLVAARFGFNDVPTQDTAAGLVTDKAFRAASRYQLRQSPRQVAQALGRAIDDCRQRGLAHRGVELLLLRALAHHGSGDWTSALTDLRQALTVAAPRHYLRVFLDETVDLGPMIERLDPQRLAGSEAAPLARRLQEVMRPAQKPGGAEGSTGVLDELTKREVAILKRLESGLSNKEIAEAIFISEGTLKWHLHNVYGKLGVKNRSGAMTKARALSIL